MIAGVVGVNAHVYCWFRLFFVYGCCRLCCRVLTIVPNYDTVYQLKKRPLIRTAKEGTPLYCFDSPHSGSKLTIILYFRPNFASYYCAALLLFFMD